MEIGKNKRGYIILLTSVMLIVVARTCLRYSLSSEFDEYQVFNNSVYYYMFFATPVFLILLNKFIPQKVNFANYLMSFINLVILFFYILYVL